MRQTRQIINIKQKATSELRTVQSSKTKNCFTWQSYIKTEKKRFLMKISKIFRHSWYECPRVFRLAPFLVGGSKWFKACFDEHNLQNRPWSDLFISSASHTSMKIAKTLQTSQKALILLTSSTDKNPPHAGRAYKRGNNYTLAITNSWASGRPWWRR